MAAETNKHVDEHDDDNGEVIIVEESYSKGDGKGIWYLDVFCY